MWWKGPDQTEIFGLLFANWYSNGNEIPVEKEADRVFWKQKLADAEQYASTDHLLMMNGVDHQPVQKIYQKQFISQMSCFQITSSSILILLTIWKQFDKSCQKT